jgi:ADP-ribose pyrophosphatase YjhB (NUDIX family)
MIKYNEDKAHYISVTVIIVKDNKYLISKRADWEKNFPGKWTVPGGKLEKSDYINSDKDTNESWYNIFEKVVKKEAKEEVNLDIKNIGYLTSMAFVRSDGIPTIIVSLYANYNGGEIKLQESMSDYAWISVDEINKYDLIEGIAEEIEMLDRFLKEGKMIEWGN